MVGPANDPAAVFAFLSATMHDGVVEVHAEDGGVNYGIVRNGNIARGFFADPGTATADYGTALAQFITNSPVADGAAVGATSS